jgi:Permease family
MKRVVSSLQCIGRKNGLSVLNGLRSDRRVGNGAYFYCLFVTLLTNMLASMKVVESVVKAEKENVGNPYPKRAGFMMGISHIASGLLEAIGSVPISGAAAFIATSKMAKRISFVIACILVMLMSLFMMGVSPCLPYARRGRICRYFPDVCRNDYAWIEGIRQSGWNK